MKILFITIFSLISFVLAAQNPVDDFLQQVEQNNKELIAARKLLEAEKAGFQTGLTPDNPTVEYGYFPGNNDALGTKTTYGISQSFDFPTVYSVRKKLASSQSQLSESEFQLFRQQKLLDAKLAFYNYSILLKQQLEYKKRLEHAAQLYQSYQTNFEKGNTSILDLNKARILNLKIKSSYQLLVQEIENVRKDLALYSNVDTISETNIQILEKELPPITTVLNEVQQKQPELQYLKQTQRVSDMQIKLAKQNWLPNLELAYEGEKEPDGTYRGIRAGIAVPLWKDKHTVQHAKAQASFTNSRSDSRITAILNETRKMYDQTTELNKIRLEYNETLAAAANVSYLDKALRLGQMSVIEYFNELAFYYDTLDAYFQIEKAYYESIAKLRAFQL